MLRNVDGKNSARIVLFLIVAWFFVRNALTPLSYDDYSYAFMWRTDETIVDSMADRLIDLQHRITSLSDIVESQYEHYHSWGGRTVAHCFVQFFVLIGKGAFNVANALTFGLLIVLINRLATGKELSAFRVLWIFFGLWIAIPNWVLSTQWLTGSCNYLWTATLQLLFLYCFISLKEPKLLLPLGLIAGWTNEASGAVLILLSAYFIYRSREKNLWQAAGLLSMMIGYALLMLAPGNLNRLQLTNPDFRFTLEVLLYHFQNGWLDVMSGEAYLFLPIIFLLIRHRTVEPNVIAFSTAAILVPTAMMFSPVFASYSCLASTVFLLIASTAAVEQISIGRSKIIQAMGLTMIAMGVLSMALSIRADYGLYRQMRAQLETIERHRNDDCVVLPPMIYSEELIKLLGDRVLNIYNGKRNTAGVGVDRNDFYTRAFASYHGLNAIRLSEP